jgi:uncharacterized membrane protein YidH (DUF202 family)
MSMASSIMGNPITLMAASGLAIVGFGYALVQIGLQATSSDSGGVMASSINNIVITNTIMLLVLGTVSYFYVGSNPGGTFERPYLFFITHLALLISIIAASVSTVTKISAPSQ